ncbi:MAG TPA: 16S rRNA (guanine(527)-N(7))-methyltransferase RsmG [Devosiaceae bacterium]|jgi:16S rRNA (guanine527-N7)-methyltransferase|nr:16S rRNA (guanine(527)-N(7))-methyltransferase RsmG [Devosiaceae bacterium]
MSSPQALAVVERFRAEVVGEPEAVAARLDSYIALLRRWQPAQNLVSRETLADVWTRHVSDSLQVLRLLTPRDQTFVDLGSGAGFPALPLAIARAGHPGTRFLLVESNGRKAAFLRTVAREIELPVTVLALRAEDLDSRETPVPDVITSRALAPLPLLCGMADRFAGETSRAIFHKGREYDEELRAAEASFSFDLRVVPSDTSPEGVLLELRNLRAKSKA